ncbi:META domain-containing protein [Flavobacterium sp. P4023]|uniref:META domain-containing protein n=1 Tax=Flavobacterium flabelliforme TaxID=2816119 RepID=A0ABS5CNJ3_9FLAO|nr:META domain-containing protein [Flavobacterium flabelliforme]MBP4140195.1 META domain-containing protein [Flavobacterium flabelliforme]
MKKLILLLAISCMAFVSCNSAKNDNTNTTMLQGEWELNYISGPRIAFQGLYPDEKPTVNFDLKTDLVSGNTGCNRFSGKLDVVGNKINFKNDNMALTKRYCSGEGESVYLSTLQKIDSYSISEDGKTLSFIMGEVEMMRFVKK